MHYQLNPGEWYKVEPGIYPWPCEGSPDRTFQVLEDDVLVKDKETGKFTCLTGVCCTNIIIPAEKAILQEKPCRLGPA